MDLSKAFDKINHDLLVAKLHSYSFSNDSLRFLYSYLINRFYKTKIKYRFNSRKQLNQGVPHGSFLGPLLFTSYLNDLFFLSDFTDLCNFADDTIFYACDMGLNLLIKRLERNGFLATDCFENNNIKLNQDKCNLLISGYKNQKVSANIGDEKIWKSNKQKGNYSSYVDLLAKGKSFTTHQRNIQSLAIELLKV